MPCFLHWAGATPEENTCRRGRPLPAAALPPTAAPGAPIEGNRIQVLLPTQRNSAQHAHLPITFFH